LSQLADDNLWPLMSHKQATSTYVRSTLVTHLSAGMVRVGDIQPAKRRSSPIDPEEPSSAATQIHHEHRQPDGQDRVVIATITYHVAPKSPARTKDDAV